MAQGVVLRLRCGLTLVGVVLVLVGAVGPLAAQDDAREVSLSVTVDTTGDCQILVDPEIAVIWRGEHKKIKKVVWAAPANDELGELFWELRWDPDKGGGSEDYFGAVDLECGASHIKVQPSTKPKIEYAEWPYAVTVYACNEGRKGAEICSVDPRIRWDD